MPVAVPTVERGFQTRVPWPTATTNGSRADVTRGRSGHQRSPGDPDSTPCRRCASADRQSSIKDDFPDPETPVTHTSRPAATSRRNVL